MSKEWIIENQAEENIRILGIRQWRRKAQDRAEWRNHSYSYSSFSHLTGAMMVAPIDSTCYSDIINGFSNNLFESRIYNLLTGPILVNFSSTQ